MHESVKISNDEERLSLLEKVTEAASSGAKVTNRLWLVTLVTTIVLFLSGSEGNTSGSMMTLPLGLGVVEPEIFFPFTFALLCVLSIALASSHAQQMRADRIANHVVDCLSQPMGKEDHLLIPLHLRDLFDIGRYPSLTRVAPLPQLITGHYHTKLRNFGHTGNKKNPLRAIVYAILKIISIFVLFLLPMWGLWLGFFAARDTLIYEWFPPQLLSPSSIVKWLVYGVLTPLGVIAALSIGAAAIWDAIACIRRSLKLYSGTT